MKELSLAIGLLLLVVGIATRKQLKASFGDRWVWVPILGIALLGGSFGLTD